MVCLVYEVCLVWVFLRVSDLIQGFSPVKGEGLLSKGTFFIVECNINANDIFHSEKTLLSVQNAFIFLRAMMYECQSKVTEMYAWYIHYSFHTQFPVLNVCRTHLFF